MDKAERKTAKRLINFRADSEDVGRLERLGKRWGLTNQTETILRAVRESLGREADTRLDEVLEFVRSAPSEMEEAVMRGIARLESVKSTPSDDSRNARIAAGASPVQLDDADPRTIPGVSVGIPLNAYCIHCQTKFSGAKGASTCIPCGRDGHVTVGNCRRCAEVARAKKLAASPTGVDDPSIEYDSKGQI